MVNSSKKSVALKSKRRNRLYRHPGPLPHENKIPPHPTLSPLGRGDLYLIGFFFSSEKEREKLTTKNPSPPWGRG